VTGIKAVAVIQKVMRRCCGSIQEGKEKEKGGKGKEKPKEEGEDNDILLMLWHFSHFTDGHPTP